MHIKARYEKAVADMQDINNYLAVEVCKMGYPIATNDIPTAGVGWDDNRKKIVFYFNPTFAQTLTSEEFCFIVAHEAIHLVNSHIFLLHEEIKKLTKRKAEQIEILTFTRKMNRAMDCVVNDSLINMYNFPKVLDLDPNISNKIKIIYGKDIVGVDCHDKTAYEVYYMLPEEPASNQKDVENHKIWESFFAPDGSFKKDFVDTLKEFVNKNIQNSALSDEQLEQINKIRKDMKNSSDSYVSKAGDSISGDKRPVDGTDRRTINWNKILYKFVDTFKPEDVWSKPNRKLIPSYPDIILPSWKDKEKEKIFCAIDSSGSIDYDALSLFVSVLRNTPKRFQIDAISFDNKCYKFDVFGKDKPQGGGGTNFQIIEDYIQQNCRKYPIAVFVLTDGWGTKVTPKYPERWGWLLYGNSHRGYCENMKNYNIVDVLVEKR